MRQDCLVWLEQRLCSLLLEGGRRRAWERLAAILQLPGEGMSENGVNTQEGESGWGERNQILMTSFEPLS